MSPSSSLSSPPTPLVGELAGSTVLPLSISAAPGVSALPSSEPFAVVHIIEPQYSVQIDFLLCDSSHLIEGVRCFIHLEEAGAQLMKENNCTFSVGNGNNPVEEAGWKKEYSHRLIWRIRIIDCDLGQSYASNQTLEHYMSNPNGQGGEYKPFKPYKHRYHVPYWASGSTLIPMSIRPQLEPLTEQQLASGSSLPHSFQQAEDALTRNGKTSADFDPMCY
ncbi:hypothetical protein OROHE_012652 [Orobanche hederae]